MYLCTSVLDGISRGLCAEDRRIAWKIRETHRSKLQIFRGLPHRRMQATTFGSAGAPSCEKGSPKADEVRDDMAHMPPTMSEPEIHDFQQSEIQKYYVDENNRGRLDPGAAKAGESGIGRFRERGGVDSWRGVRHWRTPKERWWKRKGLRIGGDGEGGARGSAAPCVAGVGRWSSLGRLVGWGALSCGRQDID